MTSNQQGFESLANTLSLGALLIAMHPHVQETLVEELENVFETADEEVTEEKMSQLIYLDMIIKEALRFWTHIPYVARYLSEDIQIGETINIKIDCQINKQFPSGEYTVPAGSSIVIPIIEVHENKKIWGEDANEFKPERFSPENIENIHSYAHLPFSRGPRTCLGYGYGVKTLKITFSYLFRNYKVATNLKVKDVTFEFMFIAARVAQGYLVKLSKRDFKNVNTSKSNS